MKQRADSKISALRSYSHLTLRVINLSRGALGSQSPLPSAKSLPKLQNSSSKRRESKPIGDLSIDEINKIIDDRILKVSLISSSAVTR
jgi:uncharacterized protein involved in outer membrane biogenesis